MEQRPQAPDGDPDGTRPLASPDPEATRALGPGQPAPASARLPQSIGDYRILRVLGMGGMGVVYEAEQQHPRRRVALKVMRNPHLVGEAQAIQFRREIRTLGRLKHPNVATIFESGQTEDGLEFYAMEMVQGDTLDVWLAKRPLPMTPKEQRLRLRMFRIICEAVHYAHLRGVIHRDLKPANIIVLDEEVPGASASSTGGPTLKILDFGLARLLDPEGQAPSLRTEVGVIMGTLQYMSPEQARGDSPAIDLRTDVYALGVILYEMMTGRRPYELGKAALSEAVRVICEEPPMRPDVSLRGSRGGNEDLSTIIGKSLEKEPDRRYDSVGALSEDVERFLSSQPIVARPQSGVYRARMFVRRHRLAVSLASTIAVLLVAFTATVALQSRRIAHEAAVSRRVSEFMTRMFQVSDPSEARGNSITAREILDRASGEIAAGLDQDPEIRARLMHTMGTVYQSLGLYPKAESLLGRSLEAQRRLYGSRHAETLATMSDLATAYVYEGRLEESERLLLEAVSAMRRLKGPEDPDTLRMMKNLSALYIDQGRYPEAEKLGLEVSRSLRRILGPEHPETLRAMLNLGNAYRLEGRFAEARRLLEEVLLIQRRIHGTDHPATLDAMNNLAAMLVDEKRYSEAEKLDDEVIAVRRRVLGPEHPETLASLNNLSIIYALEGRIRDSEELTLKILEVERRILPPRNPDLGNTLYMLACLKAKEGRKEEAIHRLQEALRATLPVAGALGLATDPDLEPLHGDPRFRSMVAEVQHTYGSPRQP
jgi:eukaryotic-like serine/threonine-protein kinase